MPEIHYRHFVAEIWVFKTLFFKRYSRYTTDTCRQKIASDGTQHLAMGPCIKNFTDDKSITGNLAMSPGRDFAQNLAI